MLGLDALAKRLLIGACFGLLSLSYVGARDAALAAVVVSYVLLIVRPTQQKPPWQ